MQVSLSSSSSSIDMEVDAMQVNDLVNCIDEQADDQSLSPECSDLYDVFGDPHIFPRVGNQYQVEFPHLISESGYYWFRAGTLHDFQVGLPIPIIWIKDEVEENKHDPQKHACKSIDFTNKIESSKLECLKENQCGLSHDELNSKPEKHRGKGHCLVPGSASDTWNEIEEGSFILGLYIFGKNLVQVKRFIGNKKMGDILSFYYGKFYKSDRYQRWSECRKMRSRKCIYGQKIFTGPRQQVLLSRLLPNKSEEQRNKLLEVSKTFAEGKMPLEDYVLTLKASVGLKALVEAVGVGRGKEDLTGLTLDSMKSTQALPVRPEMPVGKACSRLTSSEIISFLTGDFRISKTRSSDLFWEAVWPRLLARGWHSEQPGSYNYAVASKHPLVFLVPGVKKFSRKLVKGNHYFDSVSDVLSKVASDPELIELETVLDNDCTSKEGNGWAKETKLDWKNPPDQPRHCYLKLQTPYCSTGVMQFTVVDTSLASEKMTKVREQRSLPVGVLKGSAFENDSDDEDTSEEQTNESDCVNSMCFGMGKTDITSSSKIDIARGVFSDTNGLENNPSKEELPMSIMGYSNLSAASKDQKTNFLSNTQRTDAVKCQSIQRVVSGNKNVLVPVTKRRRRLTACSRANKNCNTANIFVVPRVKQEDASCYPYKSKSSENLTANIFVAARVKHEQASCCPNNSESGVNVTANTSVATRVKEEVTSCCPNNSESSENVTANIFVVPIVKQEKASCSPYDSKFSENVLSHETPSQEYKLLAGLPTQENKALADPLSNPTSIIGREAVPPTSSSGTKDQHEKPQPRTMIDLNLPVSPEVEADEPLVNEVTDRKQSNTRKESDDPSVEGTIFKPMDHSDHQPDMHTRRQSTRNRPLTAKVLEAFAFGYLDGKEKRKSRDYPRDSSISRPSRRACRRVAGSSSNDAGFEKEERANVFCNGTSTGSGNGNVMHTGFKSSEG